MVDGWSSQHEAAPPAARNGNSEREWVVFFSQREDFNEGG